MRAPFLALLAVGLGFTSLLALDADRRQAAVGELERLADRAGFGLQQVTLTGHRFALDSDIFEAIDLPRARTLLSFDARAAQARVEALPWIERASIERVVPDRVEVRVSERAPFAVWRLDGRTLLIAKDGRVLQPLPADAMPGLPRIAGAGAGREAAALLALLAAHPGIAPQVELAERVGQRRWTLRLRDGTALHLPADESGPALALASALMRAGLQRGGEIDLRVPLRVLAREGAGVGKADEPRAHSRPATGRS